MNLPDDVIGVYLAVRRPCEKGLNAADCAWRNQNDRAVCYGCQADGTRKVVTDIEVEGPQNGWETYGWDDPEGASIRCRKDGYFPVRKASND